MRLGILLLAAALAATGATPAPPADPASGSAALSRPRPGGGFAGLWDTPYGRLRLVEANGRLEGSYPGGSLEGKVAGARATFTYRDEAAGEGQFTLAPDGQRFTGRWRPAGTGTWGTWNGTRVKAVSGRRWLVVLESRWETHLSEPEYSYGEMLRAFFTRSPAVHVRHRYFTDKASLGKWLQEAALLAEPVVLYVSAHGSPAGPATDSGPAGVETFAAALRHAGNVTLLHFGACDVMRGSLPADLQKRLAPAVRFPVSGFAQTVDWGASAVTDFMFLDLVLARGMPPARAARELGRLMPFATRASTAAGYDGVSFRLLEPAE
ncbi:MAG: hypothetical protein FJZ01_05695 [Candidatus Sericytochromatia bacterium]|nr:hypothetical protein [Candidatus Tanganyikabacteria bacterium]